MISMSQYDHTKNEQGFSLIVFALSLAGLLAFAALAVDLGIANNIQNELQKAVNTAALAGSMELYPGNNIQNGSGPYEINADVGQGIALATFNRIVGLSDMTAKAQLIDPSSGNAVNPTASAIQVSIPSRAIQLQARLSAPTFFLAVVGITSLRVEAEAAAMGVPIYPMLTLPIPTGSLAGNTINNPVGIGLSNNYANINNILGAPDNLPLALGPGGRIILQPPMAIVDGRGSDLYIKELGDMEGYYVYVGKDKNTNGSVDTSEWSNITCTGSPTDGNETAGSIVGVYPNIDADDVFVNPAFITEYRFFGSGYFDIGGTCPGTSVFPSIPTVYDASVNSADFIMIVDDNMEEGFLSFMTTEPVLLNGEHSSSSPGVDIDSVAILHHSQLIPYNADDTDEDGLIDIFEQAIGSNPREADTDGDGLTDSQEILHGSSATEDEFMTNPRVNDSDGDGIGDKPDTSPLNADGDNI